MTTLFKTNKTKQNNDQKRCALSSVRLFEAITESITCRLVRISLPGKVTEVDNLSAWLHKTA